MKKRLFAILLSMTLFVLSVVGVGTINVTATDELVEVVSYNQRTGREEFKTYRISETGVSLISTETLSLNEANIMTGTPVSHITEEDLANTISPTAIFGDDNRTVVQNTEQAPYNAIVYVETVWPNGLLTYGYATAFMISDDLALTAAHTVYDEEYGGWATSVALFPAKHGVGFWNDPYGSSYSSYYEICADYYNSDNDVFLAECDWAIIKSDTTFYNGIGQLDFEALHDRDLAYSPIKICGYPRSENLIPECIQYEMDGTISSIEHKYFYTTNIDASKGQSGSPVIGANNIVYGIFTRELTMPGGATYNYATRITETLEAFFNYCIETL